MIKKRKEKIKNIVEESFHDYLIKQIKGYIDIAVGNIACQYGLDIGYGDSCGGMGLDVFIYDSHFCEAEKKDPIVFLDGPEDIDMADELMIGHYHPEDILWLVYNLKDEVFKMELDLRKYIRVKGIKLQ